MNQIEIKVVPINNEDLLRLVSELNSFFIEEWGEEVNTSYATHHLLATMNEAVVAYVDGLPVGCGCWKLLDKNIPEIKRMYVQKAYRGTPIASKILEGLEKNIKAQGFKQMVLETGNDMKTAIRFYEKAGFNIVPNFGEFVNDDLCICMRKEIVS